MVYAQISSHNYHFNTLINNYFFMGLTLINPSSSVGLPPPPPTQVPGSTVSPPGSANQLPSGADSQDKDNKYSSGLITVIALALAMGILLFVGFVWLILLRRSLNKKSPPSVIGPIHGYFNPKSEGVQLIQLRMNAYFNSKPEGVYPIHLKVWYLFYFFRNILKLLFWCIMRLRHAFNLSFSKTIS